MVVQIYCHKTPLISAWTIINSKKWVPDGMDFEFLRVRHEFIH